MSKSSNKKSLNYFVKELKVAVKEYRGDFAGLVHYVSTLPHVMLFVDSAEAEENAAIAEKAARIAARAAARVPKPVELDAEGNPVVRHRGRPKGSKNKVKAVSTGVEVPAVEASPVLPAFDIPF